MADSLARDARVPLRYQLEDRLRELAAERGPGEPIPSERELCGRFGVSRTTARAAIGRLVAEGVLERDHGRGTFVAEPKVQQVLVGLRSFSAGIARAGRRPGTRLIRRGLVPAPLDVAVDLGIQPGDSVINLERLRSVDDRPLLLNRSYFRAEFDLLLSADVEHQSVWDMLEAAYGVTVARAEETIEITSLGPEEAGLLDERVGAASFHLRLVTFDAAGRPLERVHSVYRAATRFQIELHPPTREATGADVQLPRSVLSAGPFPERDVDSDPRELPTSRRPPQR